MDTLAPRPLACGGYEASQHPDSMTLPEVTSHADASARMHSDLAALRLHGRALGINSDYIKLGQAYHIHLAILRRIVHLLIGRRGGQPALAPTLRIRTKPH